MLNNFFYKRKKIQDQRLPSLQHLKGFRNRYEDACKDRETKTILSVDKSLSKAISGLKDLSSLHSRQEKLSDAQVYALADALLSYPIISRLDLRDSSITDNGARGILELLRLQIMQAKDSTLVRKELSWEHTKYMTQIRLSGNKITDSILKEIETYLKILRREDKRLEIRVVMQQVGGGSYGVAVTSGTTIMDSGFRTARGVSTGMEEEDLKMILKLLTGTEPNKRECKSLLDQISAYILSGAQYAMRIEDLLLATCFNSPSYNNYEASPPWEALVQQQHAILQFSNDEGAHIEGSVLIESEPTHAQSDDYETYPDLQQNCNHPLLLTPSNTKMYIETSFSGSETSVTELADTYSPTITASIYPTDFVKKRVHHRRSTASSTYNETHSMHDTLKKLQLGRQNTDPVVCGEANYDKRSLDTSSEDSDRSLQREYDIDADEKADEIDITKQREMSSDSVRTEKELEEVPFVTILDVKYQGKESHIAKITAQQTGVLLLRQLAPTLPLHMLVVLVVSGIRLESFQMFQACKLPLLILLDASDNKLTNIRSDEWKGITKSLKVINFADNNFRSIPELHLCPQLQALNLSHNRIKSVNNLELCRKLRMVNLAFNNIGSCHALRPFSINIDLCHLDLGGNPLWEGLDKDDRMRRRVAIQISNLIPNLQTIGFVTNGDLTTEKIRKRGHPNLLDTNACTENTKKLSLVAALNGDEALWIATACDRVKCYADAEDNSERPDKSAQASVPRVSRQEQTLRDKERSYCVPYRSQTKSPKSPRREGFTKQDLKSRVVVERPKTSPEEDMSQHFVSGHYQRQNSSKLSAPKHPPLSLSEVKAIREAESRHCFLNNHATVAEKLESRKHIRRQKSENSVQARPNRNINKSVENRPKNFVHDEKPSKQPRNPDQEKRNVEDLSGEHAIQTKSADTRPPSTQEFLHELAVKKFYTHLEEEIATATTALSILLSMSENTDIESSKLVQYRASLVQIDILNEDETDKLMMDLKASCNNFGSSLLARYQKTPTKLSQLRAVKKSLALMLETLDKHAPGSAHVRSVCASIRASNNLPLTDARSETSSKHEEMPSATTVEKLIGFDKVTSISGIEPNEDDMVEEYDFLSTEASSEFSKLFDTSVPALDPITFNRHKRNSFTYDTIAPSSTQMGAISPSIEKADESDANIRQHMNRIQPTETLRRSESTIVETSAISEFGTDETFRAEHSALSSVRRDTASTGRFDAEVRSNAVEDDENVQMFEDWERSFDPGTNHFFWYNHSSGESQWEPPDGWPFQLDAPSTFMHSSQIDCDSDLITREADESNSDGDFEFGNDSFDDDTSLPGF
ncbi:unnamed protein product [Albugo candida]|uniref:WW domain-containing protein n=1 Tax=Albugo candida TaxID=65357 RepID=A0A024G1Y7_9STRA|nr:unnamed protein product [Albugo candida]|eukprot:CCI40318.1 unnamed protein product [Albugo candida]